MLLKTKLNENTIENNCSIINNITIRKSDFLNSNNDKTFTVSELSDSEKEDSVLSYKRSTNMTFENLITHEQYQKDFKDEIKNLSEFFQEICELNIHTTKVSV